MNDTENTTSTPEETGAAAAAGNGEAAGAATAAGSGEKKPGEAPNQQPESGGKGERRAEQLTKEQVSGWIRDALTAYTEEQKRARSEAEKLSGMNAQQKAEYERDSYRTQLESLQKQVAVSQMQGTARTMLAEKNIHAPDAMLAAIVTEDAETTKANVEAFAEMYLVAVENGIKERLKSDTPKTGKPASKMTKEQIFAIKDNMQRIRAINENMDLFE